MSLTSRKTFISIWLALMSRLGIILNYLNSLVTCSFSGMYWLHEGLRPVWSLILRVSCLNSSCVTTSLWTLPEACTSRICGIVERQTLRLTQLLGYSTNICFFLIHTLSHLPCENQGKSRHIDIQLRKTKVSSSENDTLCISWLQWQLWLVEYIQIPSCLVKDDEESIWVHNEIRSPTVLIMISLVACFI